METSGMKGRRYEHHTDAWCEGGREGEGVDSIKSLK